MKYKWIMFSERLWSLVPEEEQQQEEEEKIKLRKLQQVLTRHRCWNTHSLTYSAAAHTRDFGDWGLWRACSAGNKVCGLQVRLEDDHLLDDDAGVTDVVVFCCT